MEMKARFRIQLAAAAFALLAPVGAGATNFTDVHVFGASASDIENNGIHEIGSADFLPMDRAHLMSAAHDAIGAGTLASIPEPSTFLLLGMGLAGIAVKRRL